MHALIKELAIIQVQHRSETHINESQHLAEWTEVARLRRRFSFVLQQELPFRMRHHLCRQEVALASTSQLRSQSPVSVHAHRTERVIESEGREEANGVRGGIGDGNRVGDGDWDVNGGGDKAGAGTVTATGVEVNEGTKYGNGNGSKDGAGTGTGTRTGVETRGRSRDGNGVGNEGGIEEGGGEAKRRKKPHKNCRRYQALLFRTRQHLD